MVAARPARKARCVMAGVAGVERMTARPTSKIFNSKKDLDIFASKKLGDLKRDLQGLRKAKSLLPGRIELPTSG